MEPGVGERENYCFTVHVDEIKTSTSKCGVMLHDYLTSYLL